MCSCIHDMFTDLLDRQIHVDESTLKNYDCILTGILYTQSLHIRFYRIPCNIYVRECADYFVVPYIYAEIYL